MITISIKTRKYNFNNNKGKYFFLVLLFGLLIKYNFILLKVFYVPSLIGVVLQNLVLIIIFIFFIFPLIKNKKGRILLYLGYLFLSILFMANYVYYDNYGNYLSITDIIMGETTGRFALIEVWFRYIFDSYGFFFILDVIFIPIIFGINGYNEDGYIIKIYKRQRRYSQILIIILITTLLFSQIYIANTILGGDTPKQLYQKGTSYFVNVYGILPLYLIELHSHFTQYELVPKKEIPELMGGELDGESIIDDETNIIVVQWESLDKKLVDYKYKEKELTPFINKLKENSLYFKNFYAQHVSGSFNADFSFLTSLYPINRNYTYRENDLTEFDSLVRILNKKGYNTMAFHANNPNFFHRDKAFSELGFDFFYAGDDYSFKDCIMEAEKTHLGINDYDFFKQSLDFLEKSEEPFFGFFITVTSHTPFDYYPLKEKTKEYNDIDNKLVRDFFNSITFVDKSIEMFFSKLKNRDFEKDILFVIYSDHESALKEDIYTSLRDFNLKRNVKQPHHIPLLIFHPDIKPDIIETTGSTTDLAPTILDLLGEDKTPEEFAGKSLLYNKERPIVFLHEIPQILYKNQLFVKEKQDFKRIGYLDNYYKTHLSNNTQKNVYELIEYLHYVINTRKRRKNK